MSPTDPDAYFGPPDLLTPLYDEVHVSATFTWDGKAALHLAKAWKERARTVRIGGPAFDDSGGEFVSGMYLKQGVTITSRGCPKSCCWCAVGRREGRLRELPIIPGHIIQDNNLLACSKEHLDRVFSMLSGQSLVMFTGGLDVTLTTPEIIDRLKSLRIRQLWFSYDHPGAEKHLKRVFTILNPSFYRNQKRVYVLVGYRGDDLNSAEGRLRTVYELGGLPYVMQYRNFDETGSYVMDGPGWRELRRNWSRPAIINTRMKNNHRGS